MTHLLARFEVRDTIPWPQLSTATVADRMDSGAGNDDLPLPAPGG